MTRNTSSSSRDSSPGDSATARRRQQRELARYYRWLDRWVRWSRAIRPYSGFDTHTVHRLLDDPDGGPPSPLVVHRLMLEGVELPPEPRVLDAGCGYGGTAFDLQPKIGGHWLGLTLSPTQIERARREAAARGLADCVRFELRSYDAPLPGPFDLAIAIESLVHSPDPSASVANLASALAPGGSLVVVDDMPADPFPARHAAALKDIQRMWRLPVLPSEHGWRRAFENAGLEVVRSADFTHLVHHRPADEMDRQIARDRRRARLLGWTGLHMIYDNNVGGLLIEQLELAGALEYRVLVGRKAR